MAWTHSRYQKSIFDFVTTGEGDGVVRATAGSGKTTTLKHVTSLIPNDHSVCFFSFNRSIREELRSMLPSRIRVKTLHGFGRQSLRAYWTKIGKSSELKFVGNKYDTVIKNWLCQLDPRSSAPRRNEATSFAVSLLRFMRINRIDLNDESQLRQTSIRYNLNPLEDPRLENEVISSLHTVGEIGKSQFTQDGVIDYDDMICFPSELRIQPEQFDFVCVDEAQDMSVAALQLVLASKREDGRILFVGDPRQAINGFAGADTDSFDRIIKETGAVELPLSVTFRCPKSHVRLAKCVAPEIEAMENAPEGKVHVIRETALSRWANKGDLIICRANGPLISACLELTEQGKRASVLGVDISARLISLSKKVFSTGLFDWKKRIESYLARETSRVEKRVKDEDHQNAILSLLRDELQCLTRFVNEIEKKEEKLTTQALKELIKQTFDDEPQNQITLATIHKAKGREANRVFLLYPHLIPASYAKTAEAVRGEACVQFVALTRAKRDLIFVEEKKSKPQKMLDDFVANTRVN